MAELSIKLQLRPFLTPNYVQVKLPFKDSRDGSYSDCPSVHISELDAETLKYLCEEFTREVFKKAGKEIPK